MANGTETSEKGSGKTRDAVATAAALVALIGSAYKLVLEVQGKPNTYALFGFGLLAFVAVYVLAWLARRWLAPPSTFRRPSALDIGRKYLRGRDTDLDNLLNRLKDFPLVWLVVNFWVLGLVLGFFGWGYLDAEQKAQDLFYSFTLSSETTEDEADALWRLSRERGGARKAFYKIVFLKERNAERFLEKSDHILQATLGLSEENRRTLLVKIIQDNCYKKPAFEYSNICLELFNALPFVHGSKEVSGLMSVQIVEVVTQTQDSLQLHALARGLETLIDNVRPEAAENAFNRIVEVMAQTQESPQLAYLASGLGSLGDKLSPEAAENAAEIRSGGAHATIGVPNVEYRMSKWEILRNAMSLRFVRDL